MNELLSLKSWQTQLQLKSTQIAQMADEAYINNGDSLLLLLSKYSKKAKNYSLELKINYKVR